MLKNRSILLALPLLLALFAGGCNSTGAQYLTPGDQAPGFNLMDIGGGMVSLEDVLGEEPVLLYFSMADG